MQINLSVMHFTIHFSTVKNFLIDLNVVYGCICAFLPPDMFNFTLDCRIFGGHVSAVNLSTHLGNLCRKHLALIFPIPCRQIADNN